MADFSKMSNDELIAIASGKAPAAPKEAAPSKGGVDYSKLSNEELMSIASGTPAPKSIQNLRDAEQAILKPIAAVGNFVDKYTGAPARAALGALQDGKNPLGAAWDQFGEDPSKAPSGKDIAAKAGLSTDQFKTPLKGLDGTSITVSPAGVAGLAIDVAADPTNLIPGGALAKGAAKLGVKGAVKGAELGVKGAAALTDAATGTKIASKATEAVGEAISKITKPTVAEDFGDFVKIAEKNGIDPTLLNDAVEFGPNSIVTRAARAKAEGLSGEPLLKKHQAGLDAVQDALIQKIEKIGGSDVSPQAAGRLIREGYDEAVKNLFDSVDVTHGSIMAANPSLKVGEIFPKYKVSTGGKVLKTPDAGNLAGVQAKLLETQRFARTRALKGITDTQRRQGTELMRAIDAIRQSDGSYGDVVTAMRDIGEIAFKPTNALDLTPSDVKSFRDLYFSLNDALVTTVRKELGPETANNLLASNKRIADFLEKKSAIKDIVGNKRVADEDVFRALVQNGDSNEIATLKAILPPEKSRQLKGAFISGLIKRNLDDDISFRQVGNAMRTKKNVVDNLLDPEEAIEIAELLRLGDRFGTPVLSTSGTGASNALRDIKSAVMSDAMVEGLRGRARGLSIPDSAAGQTSKGQSQGLLEKIRSLEGKDLMLPQRSKKERALKGAQVISVQDANKEKEADEALRKRLGR